MLRDDRLPARRSSLLGCRSPSSATIHLGYGHRASWARGEAMPQTGSMGGTAARVATTPLPPASIDTAAMRWRAISFVVAVVVPAAISLLVGPDVRWLIVPASLMLLTIVMVSFLGGAWPGLLA